MGNFCSKPIEENLSREKEQSMNQQSVNLDSFKVETTLGRGSFGKVLLVSEKSTGDLFAMKAISKAKIKENRIRDQTLSEREILATTSSNFIVKMQYAFQTPFRVYLVLEFLQGGELAFHMQRFGTFPVHFVRFYASEILLALEDVHEMGYIYRDLKPANILLDAEGHIKLADFNLAKLAKSPNSTRTMCGTPEYIAPEVIKKMRQTHKIDYWSLGVIVYQMLHGKSPFFSENQSLMYKNIEDGSFDIAEELPPDAADLIRMLLRVNPERRPQNSSQIKNCSFFKDIDWEMARCREIKPPIKPMVMGKKDLGYFHRHHDSFTPDQKQNDEFANFSYVRNSGEFAN